jgi:hypothetical protein
MLDRWRVSREIVRRQFKVDYAELLGGGVLLLVGGLVLGYGLASFANAAAGFAVSISGGVMLFAGIILGIRSFIAVVHALESAAKADFAKNIKEITVGHSETKFTYAKLHGQVAKVQKDLKHVLTTIRNKGFRAFT